MTHPPIRCALLVADIGLVRLQIAIYVIYNDLPDLPQAVEKIHVEPKSRWSAGASKTLPFLLDL